MLGSLFLVFTLLMGGAVATPATESRESIEAAAYHVKEMVHRQTTGTIASVFPPDSEHAGHPFALMEYHAPCFPAPALTMLLMPIALSTRNILANSSHPATYTISEKVPFDPSPMSQARVAFIGNITVMKYENIPEDELEIMEKCFTWYHPDAKSWIPYQSQHPFNSFWAKFQPSDIYYVGGFGDSHYIGHIPIDLYTKVGEGVKSSDHWSDRNVPSLRIQN
ncbi:pyridoxamine 5'-phosphate oxidase-domain-containing protein [Kockovaella imperatae]|uniref:Pyridoxamine 5'-phosphate oxidase-domain-containing protein n=1 Tax=Kockovaella imperatae TaxID=4999 RepID=A0A1Y1UGN9_9TREE|nr:pyridoxamine 5'-phosphate oxidase-domain-containing protein [Kockovaella imperatae]ORX37139.1 pyridoxamine 5'-phosphate oxidase-domain-containing protein [Kockovaella imperatae]